MPRSQLIPFLLPVSASAGRNDAAHYGSAERPLQGREAAPWSQRQRGGENECEATDACRRAGLPFMSIIPAELEDLAFRRSWPMVYSVIDLLMLFFFCVSAKSRTLDLLLASALSLFGLKLETDVGTDEGSARV